MRICCCALFFLFVGYQNSFASKTSTETIPSPQTSSLKTSTAWWSYTYLVDWSVSLGLAASYFGWKQVAPFERDFDLQDPSIGLKFNQDSVPEWLAGSLALGLPLLAFSLFQTKNKSGHDFHHASLSLVSSLSLTLFLTEALKVGVARLRPDFLDRCQPNSNKICQQTDASLLRNGRLSFPSGHSSIMFSGMTTLTLYLAGQLKIIEGKGLAWKIPVVLAPWLIASGVAVTRSLDNRHHWQDILVGSLLGAGASLLTYHFYFHPFWSKESDQAKTRLRLQILPQISSEEVGISVFGTF